MTSDTDLNPPRTSHGSDLNSAGLKQHTAMDNQQITTDASPENHSRLMTLPQEIKREIYLLLMGNRDVYITVRNVRARSSNGRFSKGRMVRVGKETGFTELSPNGMFPIYSCAQPSKENQVYLKVLRASKQNYYEARLLPYTHNTFHMEVETLEHFLSGRRTYQEASLRSLSLKINMFGLHNEPYCECLMFIAARSLTGLRRFKMLVDVGLVSDGYDLLCWTEGMHVWGIRELDRAQVTVEVDIPAFFISAWKLAQMKYIAGALSKELMDRNLAEEHLQIAMKVQRRLARRYQKRLLKRLGSKKA